VPGSVLRGIWLTGLFPALDDGVPPSRFENAGEGVAGHGSTDAGLRTVAILAREAHCRAAAGKSTGFGRFGVNYLTPLGPNAGVRYSTGACIALYAFSGSIGSD
jgi:hypothetical protein